MSRKSRMRKYLVYNHEKEEIYDEAGDVKV